jgi:hypothetical protein
MKRAQLASAIATATARANAQPSLENRPLPRRARLFNEDGSTTEWKSKSLRAYQRRTRGVDALITSAYRSGANTRRVKRALATLFKGASGKDIVSRTWRRVTTDWNALNARPCQGKTSCASFLMARWSRRALIAMPPPAAQPFVMFVHRPSRALY